MPKVTRPRNHQKPALFSEETLKEHRLHRISMWRYIRSSTFLVVLSAPVIYVCGLPFLLLDLAVSVYQSICFPIYGIPKARREDYLIFDRGHLAYLNPIEKLGCVYCSYANGLLAYIAEIGARTEQHFCPIKHARRSLQLHSRDSHMLPYGDALAYRTQSERIAQDYTDLINIQTK